MKSSRLNRGFTLTELIIGISLASILVGLSSVFVIQSLRAMSFEAKRVGLNQIVRKLTSQLANETADASEFYIMPGYQSLDGNADPMRIVTSAAAINRPVIGGGSGDCLILVYRDNPSNQALITRLRVYYRDVTNVGDGGFIRCVTLNVPSGNQTNNLNYIVNNLIPNLSATHSGQNVIIGYKTFGLVVSGTTTPIFFFNDRSGQFDCVAVNCRFEPENNGVGLNQLSASSFNYTIAPRH